MCPQTSSTLFLSVGAPADPPGLTPHHTSQGSTPKHQFWHMTVLPKQDSVCHRLSPPLSPRRLVPTCPQTSSTHFWRGAATLTPYALHPYCTHEGAMFYKAPVLARLESSICLLSKQMVASPCHRLAPMCLQTSPTRSWRWGATLTPVPPLMWRGQLPTLVQAECRSPARRPCCSSGWRESRRMGR